MKTSFSLLSHRPIGFVALTLMMIFVFSCTGNAAGPTGKSAITIAFYNVENLFDTEDDPAINDEDFLPDGRYHWTEANYQVKLANLSKVIDKLGDEDGPEILGLSEVENQQVVEDLIHTPLLKDKGYAVVHKNSPDHRGIDVALIYKKSAFTVTNFESLTVPFPEDPDMATRDVLMVTGKTENGEDLTVFVNHWSSRRGGPEASEYKRMRAAGVVRTALESLYETNPKMNIVLVGDFNDEPSNKSLFEGIDASGEIGKEESLLFNPMYALMKSGDGSLMYKKNWDMFDQVIMSRNLLAKKGKLTYVEGSAAVYRPAYMQVESGDWATAPRRSHIRSNFMEDGYSDHFPVYAHFQLK